MAFQETAANTTIGIKRKLSKGDDADNELFNEEAMNPSKRHTESERIPSILLFANASNTTQ